jgi:hypothetical protein
LVLLAKSSEGGSREARVWAYLNREGRHWYEFTESRKRDGPARVFGNFTGYLQADASGGYDRLFFSGGATEVACWAHVRRKFLDAEEVFRARDSRLGRDVAIKVISEELASDPERLRGSSSHPFSSAPMDNRMFMACGGSFRISIR